MNNRRKEISEDDRQWIIQFEAAIAAKRKAGEKLNHEEA